MNRLYKYKIIPQNYVIEEAFLGILLIYPNIFDIIKNRVKKEYFFLETNQIIYISLTKINIKSKSNIVGLLYRLYNEGILKKIGGIDKIVQIMKQGKVFVCSSEANYYIENLIVILNENYLKRLIIQFGYNIIQIGYIKNIQSRNVYTKILSYMSLIETEVNDGNTSSILNIKDMISKKLVSIKYQNMHLEAAKKHIEVRSGFKRLDDIINRLPQGNLIIIAGRPSIGKTSFAMNIAYNIFLYQNISLLIFSLEMSYYEIFNKIISIGLDINFRKETIKTFNKEQWQKISNLCNRLLKHNIHINDKNNIDINYIDQISKKLKKKNESINLIIIDYLQLVEIASEKQRIYNRSQEIGYITRKLKLLAQFLGLPIIVISQLNRNIETRSYKEPLLSDLKESGCIRSKMKVDIKFNCANKINIQTIINNNQTINLHKLNNFKKNRIIGIEYTKELRNITICINISYKYIFQYSSRRKQLFCTHNHRCLHASIWITCKKIMQSTTINTTSKLKQYLIYRNYIKKIIFNKYGKSYDVNQNRFFSIISEEIITHNSIEQDADIILILYEQEHAKSKLHSKDEKIVDLKIAKNRNGYTGYCQLNFVPQTSVFKDIR
uniref:DNA 5'-3' helicase n=1 Tax=Pleurostichidium falkenbergii TaxID=121064 RepID=A0A4D6UXZ0_9FLOR|nr:replication helicase subunit [Pleurostichidium falkenbergii]QCH39736.1 replication helicase subunit [Pleurostichidium falkenbergii]